MVLVKRRQYGSLPSGMLTSIGPTGGTPITAISHHAPHSTTDSFLRLRAEFTMEVEVGTVGAPPESWWPMTTVTLIAWWTPSSSTAIGNITGTSEHFLGSQLLVPELFPSQTAPGEYVIIWRQTEPLVTETSRRDVTASSGPTVSIGFTVYDTTPALDGTYAGVGISYETRLFSLWGSTT
jgi:hypothetical protein